MRIDKYVEGQLRKDKKVIVEIDKIVVNGFIQMNWLIDKKYLLEDFPPEVFEGYHCPALKNDDVCSEWQKEGFRPICRYWPFHPDNLELFPNCGFSFERIPE